MDQSIYQYPEPLALYQRFFDILITRWTETVTSKRYLHLGAENMRILFINMQELFNIVNNAPLFPITSKSILFTYRIDNEHTNLVY